MNEQKSNSEPHQSLTKDEIDRAVSLYRDLLEPCENEPIRQEESRQIFNAEFDSDIKSRILIEACKMAFAEHPTENIIPAPLEENKEMMHQIIGSRTIIDQLENQKNKTIEILIHLGYKIK